MPVSCLSHTFHRKHRGGHLHEVTRSPQLALLKLKKPQPSCHMLLDCRAHFDMEGEKPQPSCDMLLDCRVLQFDMEGEKPQPSCDMILDCRALQFDMECKKPQLSCDMLLDCRVLQFDIEDEPSGHEKKSHSFCLYLQSHLFFPCSKLLTIDEEGGELTGKLIF